MPLSLSKEWVSVPSDTMFTAAIGSSPRSKGGYGIAPDLRINLPSVPRADAERLVHAAHAVCPYSNATRGNIDVGLTVA